MQLLNAAHYALKQRNMGVTAQIVVAIPLNQPRIFFIRQFWQQGLQGLDQPQADDLARGTVTRDRLANIFTGALDRIDNHTGGIHQRAVPIEDQQVKLLGHFYPMYPERWQVRWAMELRPAF